MISHLLIISKLWDMSIYLIAFPAQHDQQHNCRSCHKNRNKLRRGERADASPDQISAEKLNGKPSDTVKEQVADCRRPGLFRLRGDHRQHDEIQKIQCAGVELCRNQGYAVRRVVRVCKNNMQRATGLFPVTAACKEAADPPESLSERNGRQHDICVAQEGQLSDPAVKQNTQNTGDDAAVNYKSVG